MTLGGGLFVFWFVCCGGGGGGSKIWLVKTVQAQAVTAAVSFKFVRIIRTSVVLLSLPRAMAPNYLWEPLQHAGAGAGL